MKRAKKEASSFGFVGVAEFAGIVGLGESTVRHMVGEGLLGDVFRSSDKPNGEIKINVWTALEKRGMKAETLERLRHHLRLDRVEDVPLPTSFTFTVTITSGLPVQCVSSVPAVAPR